MGIEIFPAAVTSTIDASSITATTSNTLYEGRISFDPAIYEITCASGTITKVEFYSGVGEIITTGITTSGTVSINLASAADRVRVWTDTGSNIVVTITKIASALSNVFSGTLDTVTSTGTYTGTSTSGYGYSMLVGGGGGGGGNTSTGSGGGGGGGGGHTGKVIALTGSMSVTIGARGNGGMGGAGNNVPGNAGGSSNFSNLTANGGGGGAAAPNTGNTPGSGGSGGNGSGGTYSASGNAGAPAGSGGNTGTSVYPFIATSIGTGGAARTAGTGYGGGGGAGHLPGYGNREDGAQGSPGVLYVLRF